VYLNRCKTSTYYTW